MASSEKSKKSRTKAPRSRPTATSLLTQPVVEDSSSLTALSSFSSNGNWFAFISLAIDKHRLRVYDTVTGQSAAEHVVDSGRVTTLTWSTFDPSASDETTPPNKKKRRKRNSQAADVHPPTSVIEVVVLGLSDGTLSFFSPTHGRVLRTLSHSTSTSAILSVAFPDAEDTSIIWTSGADAAIRLWNARTNDMLGSWKTDDRIPYSSMVARPGVPAAEEGRMDILVANHGIRLLSTTSNPSEINFETRKPKELASFTGHASSIVHLQWDASQKPPNRFLSAAEGDRFVYIWEVPDLRGGLSKEGKIITSIPLDSDVRSISLSLSSSPSAASTITRQNLLTLSASGKISVYPIPPELTPPASTNKTEHKVPTLLPRTSISSSKKKGPAAQVVGASFALGMDGHIRVARLIGGVKPIFKLIPYLDESGGFIQDINLVQDDANDLLASQSQTAAPNKRYVEPPSLAIRSGVELGQDQEMDDLARLDGDLDVDLAELSLGQRLTALSGADDMGRTSTSDSDGEAAPKQPKKSDEKKQHEISAVPANSLTRTLIQALHSSDSKLLETCLAHSDPHVIRNTVRRLPPQLAVPLLTACTERLGRGARAGNMKGRGGAASSQRGTGLIAWVKAVLAVHSGHLMTIPDLVARLSGLHATLTARLTLQESLLSLSGRLDMVLSQIEMRSSIAPAPLAPQRGKPSSNRQEKAVNLYVEGQSEDEEQMDADVEVENGDDAGSVEDVELGGDSQDDDDEDKDGGSEEEEEEDDEEDDEEDSDGGPVVNGFIDDEAEEFDDEEDEDSE